MRNLNHLLVILGLLAMLNFVAACSDNAGDEKPSGDGDRTDGDAPDGDGGDGDAGDGDAPDGDGSDGDAPDGDGPLPGELACIVDPAAIDRAEVIAFAPASVPHDEVTFSVLVQSGAMTPDGAILWTYTSDNQPKRLKVWRTLDEAGSVALVVDSDVSPQDGYIKHRVTGLAPKTEYHYAFFAMNGEQALGRSLIGRFKTAFPEGCLAPLVIGGTHGTNFSKQPYKALEITATYDLDMFVHLGDYSYNDNAVLDGGLTKFRETVSIDAFRSIWHRTLDDPGFRELLAATGQYIVRDDHEVCDNSCLEHSNFREDIHRTGMDAMIETLPIEADGHKIWRSYRWGDTAEIFLLDQRSERLPETRETPDAIYIGREQMDWLKAELKASTAHFKIILNSVPITLFDHPIWLMAHDRWQGYPAQREEILDHIVNEGIENVWWLTGDFHLGSVNRLQSSGPYAAMWEIMMGPGGNDGNPIWSLVNGDLEIYPPEEIIPPHQFDFFYGHKATTIVTFDPIRDVVHVLFFDAETGAPLYDKELTWTPYNANP